MQRYGVLFRSRNCAFHKVKHFFVTDVPPVFSCSVHMTFPDRFIYFQVQVLVTCFCVKTPQNILPLFFGTFWAFMRPTCHICPAWKPGLVGRVVVCCSFAQVRGGGAPPPLRNHTACPHGFPMRTWLEQQHCLCSLKKMLLLMIIW